MSTLVNQLTIEQAHKEYNSLVDKIAAKCQQLDSGEFGTVGTPGFNAKSAKFASLCALSKTAPANACTTLQTIILQALKSYFQI